MGELSTNERLGYPSSKRLLIVNADDFGMCHANNEATLRALQAGIATSTTLMSPCPWASEAAHMLHEHPELPFGVHLTVISEHAGYRWGPLAPQDCVSSLVDETGRFFRFDERATLMGQAKLDEVEAEFRAQIDFVQATGRKPTHFDWHCLADGGRPDIFDLTLRLAREFRVALRVHDPVSAKAYRPLPPISDFGVMDSYALGSDDKTASYIELLRNLPSGLSEWAVHPSLGDAEAQAMEPDTWRVRKADFDFLVSDEAKRVIDEERIELVDFRLLQQAWAA